ncbi:MAG: 4-hydroxy-tetrahydrodipicolinate synthase [Armatimonadetes bacterium]|nr:4-hydroxy-tetrahydrodipicolinate synthase [Armatimonadota bacterium]MBS1728042.1 4-hydroxy-tetrahydrodipicolinate synthase [Armatimonadota bacterium]
MGSYFAPRDWGTLLTAMITPYNSDGAVNFKEARRIAAFLVDEQKNDGIVVNGTTGESPTTTEAEKLKLIEELLDEVGDRAAIVAGCGTYNTAESVHMTKEATARGVHGIMIVNPYYNKPGQRGLYAHYKACAEATELPVLLYNIIPRSSINLDTPTLLELAKIPNIVAVKEASGNIAQISDVCGSAPSGFRVYSGDDGLTVPILSVGGYGIVSVAGHVIGKQIKEMVSTFASNPAKAAAIHHQLMPVVKACFCAPNPGPVKYMLTKMGFDCESMRLPLVELDDSEKKTCDAALAIIKSLG